MRYLSKTAVLFDSETARTAGLVHEIAVDTADLDNRIAAHIKLALGASPDAIARTGRLIDDLGYVVTEEMVSTGLKYNAKAAYQMSPEGISSFLEKRKPEWMDDG